MRLRHSFVMALVLALALFTAPLFAANQELVCGTKIVDDDYLWIYETSFTTTSALDTVIIIKTTDEDAGFNISYLGQRAVPADSGVTIQFETTETTPDSVRFKILCQISYDAAPSGDLVSDDWMTFETVTVDSADGSKIAHFNPFETGLPYNFRVWICETAAAKDAIQTVTVRLAFPKMRERY